MAFKAGPTGQLSGLKPSCHIDPQLHREPASHTPKTLAGVLPADTRLPIERDQTRLSSRVAQTPTRFRKRQERGRGEIKIEPVANKDIARSPKRDAALADRLLQGLPSGK